MMEIGQIISCRKMMPGDPAHTLWLSRILMDYMITLPVSICCLGTVRSNAGSGQVGRSRDVGPTHVIIVTW